MNFPSPRTVKCSTCLLPAYQCDCSPLEHRDISFSPSESAKIMDDVVISLELQFSNKELMLIRLLAANAMIAPDVSRTAMTAHENVIAVANAILAHRSEKTS